MRTKSLAQTLAREWQCGDGVLVVCVANMDLLGELLSLKLVDAGGGEAYG
jgi:hypothetical protein